MTKKKQIHSASQSSSRRLQQKYSSKRQQQQGFIPKAAKNVSRSSTTLSAASKRRLGLSLCKETVAVNDLGRTIGQDHVNARYLESDIENVIQLRFEGYSYTEISRMMDMPIRTIRGYLDGSRRSQSVAGWKVVKRWKKEN